MTARSNSEARRWVLSALVCAPYFLTWLSPALLAPEHLVATGFPQYDQPYYAANGRAIFERGNGLAGPNPFDADPNAPAIYFHWLTWIFGALIVYGGLDPGLVYVVTGVLAALGFSRLTLALVSTLSRDSPRAPLLFVLAMWGGGLAVVAQLLAALVTGTPTRPLNALEPFLGWWFLPWGRNVVYATEAVYHVIVLGLVLAFLRRRFAWMLACTAAIAATHPFTGAQALACVGAWLALNQLAPSLTGVARLGLPYLVAYAAIGAAFVGYYVVFLPSVPQHAQLQQQWALAWQESLRETVLAYLPVLVLATLAVARRKSLERVPAVFLAVLAGVSFALSHHHWLLPSHQPLHFTRGYLWLSLFLLGLPLLDELAGVLLRARARALLLPVLLCLACADNAGFVLEVSRDGSRRVATLDRELVHVYDLIARRRLRGVLLSNDAVAGYLAATYTSARPYFGHDSNTPDARARMRQLNELFSTGRAGSWFGGIDLLVIQGRLGRDPSFEPLFVGERYSLYQRRTRRSED